MKKSVIRAGLGALLLSAVSTQALACACGCGVFDIGGFNFGQSGGPMGITVWGRYDYMVQNQNYEGTSKAPASDNTDKKIETSFYSVGGSYMINHDWGVMAMIPFYQRAFTTTYTDPLGNNNVGAFNLFAPGDLKLLGSYSGFIPDHSLGVLFGVKLPTGQWRSPSYSVNGNTYSLANGNPIYDRDTMPGTGSTDLIVGAFKRGFLTADQKLVYFAQATYQFAITNIEGYRAGNELDAAAGLSCDFGAYGPFASVAPLAQVINSWRSGDSGPNSSSNSGYERILLSPGLNLRIGAVNIYADVAIPVYQFVNHAANLSIEGTEGQLVASTLYKAQVSYDF